MSFQEAQPGQYHHEYWSTQDDGLGAQPLEPVKIKIGSNVDAFFNIQLQQRPNALFLEGRNGITVYTTSVRGQSRANGLIRSAREALVNPETASEGQLGAYRGIVSEAIAYQAFQVLPLLPGYKVVRTPFTLDNDAHSNQTADFMLVYEQADSSVLTPILMMDDSGSSEERKSLTHRELRVPIGRLVLNDLTWEEHNRETTFSDFINIKVWESIRNGRYDFMNLMNYRTQRSFLNGFKKKLANMLIGIESRAKTTPLPHRVSIRTTGYAAEAREVFGLHPRKQQ